MSVGTVIFCNFFKKRTTAQNHHSIALSFAFCQN